VVWEFVYSFENLAQFMGRLARVRGQSGVCVFITFKDALRHYNKGDRDTLEVAKALQSQTPLDKLVYAALHSDAAVQQASQPPRLGTLTELKRAVAGTKWYAGMML
jgi:hypothetical protein